MLEKTKGDVINIIYEKLKEPKAKIKEIINTYLETIAEELLQGHQVNIFGFGTYRMYFSAAKKHKVISNEIREIPARIKPKFKFGKTMLNLLTKDISEEEVEAIKNNLQKKKKQLTPEKTAEYIERLKQKKQKK